MQSKDDRMYTFVNWEVYLFLMGVLTRYYNTTEVYCLLVLRLEVADPGVGRVSPF